MTEEKKEEKKEFKLVETPTQWGLAIQTPEETAITTDQALVLLLNKVTKIESLLG